MSNPGPPMFPNGLGHSVIFHTFPVEGNIIEAWVKHASQAFLNLAQQQQILTHDSHVFFWNYVENEKASSGKLYQWLYNVYLEQVF